MNKSCRRFGAICFAAFAACLLAATSALTGCVSSPVQPPTSDLFGQLQKPDLEMPAPVAMPARPAASVLSTAGSEYLAFDAAAAKQLLIRDDIGQRNTELATECSAGFNEIVGAYGVLLEQARTQERMFNHVGERWAQAETELQRQDVIHDTENWINRALMLLAVGMAL